MADEKTEAAAESPDRMSDEERQQLVELKRKEDADKRADAEEAAAEAAAELEEKRAAYADRPLFYVLVRHMGRSPRTRTLRAARAGHRRQGVILDDGTRIKKKGRRRYTQVDLASLADGHGRLLEYVRVGTLEVLDPKYEQVIPYEDLCKLVERAGEYVAHGRYDKALRRYEAKMDEWAEQHAAWEESEGPAEGEPKEPTEPVRPDFELREESIVEQDEIPGSDFNLNAAPSDLDDDPPPLGEDATRDDLGDSALAAAVDQHEAEMTGEANPSASETVQDDEHKDTVDTTLDDPDGPGQEQTEEKYGEEEMLKMSLDELKGLAVKEFGVPKKGVKKLRTKKEVVALIKGAADTAGEEG